MRQRLARKILSRCVRDFEPALKAYGKERIRIAYRQYYGYYLFYEYKYKGRPEVEEGEVDWYTIVTGMYYKRHHRINARTCRIRLTPRQTKLYYSKEPIQIEDAHQAGT